MRLLVTGANGQLARNLVAMDGQEISVTAIGRPELDICRPETIRQAIVALRPDIVINAAAYTAVDMAETEAEMAYAINCDGARNVAEAAAGAGLPVVHVSTDYVFSGDKDLPYVETDETGPTGVYGASKLAGETAVASVNPRHLIVRTAWVYSNTGTNFVRTMLRLAGDRDEINVVADQIGNPTSAADLAFGLVKAASSVLNGGSEGLFGTYHLAGCGSTSWAGLARQIYSVSKSLGGPWSKVIDIPTSQYPTPAKRPANSRLSNEKFSGTFGWSAPPWQKSCETVVTAILNG